MVEAPRIENRIVKKITIYESITSQGVLKLTKFPGELNSKFYHTVMSNAISSKSI